MFQLKDGIDGWVAKEEDLPTEVIEPIYIQYPMVEELMFYHPTPPNSGIGPCKFRLIKDEDDQGPYARVELHGGNWNPTFARLLVSLKLRVADLDGREVLRATDIPGVPMGKSNWVATAWQIAKTQNASGQIMFQDVISWADRDGNTCISSYGWQPYKS